MFGNHNKAQTKEKTSIAKKKKKRINTQENHIITLSHTLSWQCLKKDSGKCDLEKSLAHLMTAVCLLWE